MSGASEVRVNMAFPALNLVFALYRDLERVAFLFPSFLTIHLCFEVYREDKVYNRQR
jgi:hypothetical protein